MAYPSDTYPSKALGVAVATEAAFGTYPAGESSWQIISPKADGLEAGKSNEIIDPAYSRDDMKTDASIVGISSCTVKLAMSIRAGIGAAADTEAAAIYPDLESLLKACCGTVSSDTGAACDGGSTSTAEIGLVNPTSVFQHGSVVMIDPDGSGTVYPRQIIARDDTDDAVTFTDVLETAVDSSGVLYAGTQIIPSNSMTSSCSVQVNTLKKTNMLTHMYSGLMGTFGLKEAEAGKELLFEFDMKGDNYTVRENTTALVTPTTHGIPAVANRPAQLLARNATCWIASGDGSSAPTSLPCAKFSFVAGHELAEAKDATGTNARSCWVLTGRKPVVKISIPYTKTHEDAYAAGTSCRFMYSVGDETNGFALAAEHCQITECGDGDIEGIRSLDLTLECKRPEPSGGDADMPEWAIALFGKQSA